MENGIYPRRAVHSIRKKIGKHEGHGVSDEQIYFNSSRGERAVPSRRIEIPT